MRKIVKINELAIVIYKMAKSQKQPAVTGTSFFPYRQIANLTLENNLPVAKKDKIGFMTKVLSNRHFLNEVSVEGGLTNTFNYTLGRYNHYAAQIIESGNCITLLSKEFKIKLDDFFNTRHFENFARFVFWTFNKSFLLKLLGGVENQNAADLQRYRELLLENPVAYPEPVPANAGEELRFCYTKSGNLKKDPDYELMYSLALRVARTFSKSCQDVSPENVGI